MYSIKGRSDDMLIIRGVNLFHTQVEEVIHQLPFLSPNYQLIVERKGTMDAVCVEVEVMQGVDSNNNDLKIQLKHKLKDNIGLSLDVKLRAFCEIPRSQGGKLNRIIDKRS